MLWFLVKEISGKKACISLFTASSFHNSGSNGTNYTHHHYWKVRRAERKSLFSEFSYRQKKAPRILPPSNNYQEGSYVKDLVSLTMFHSFKKFRKASWYPEYRLRQAQNLLSIGHCKENIFNMYSNTLKEI